MYPVNKCIKIIKDIQEQNKYTYKKILIVRNRIYYKIRYNLNTKSV